MKLTTTTAIGIDAHAVAYLKQPELICGMCLHNRTEDANLPKSLDWQLSWKEYPERQEYAAFSQVFLARNQGQGRSDTSEWAKPIKGRTPLPKA